MYSCLDLQSGYWQVPMHPDSIEKTAFVSRKGQYEWVVMPFGLKNAVACFSRLMTSIFEDLLYKGLLIYVDDIVAYQSNFDDMICTLTEVCSRLRKASLKLKPKKCNFFQTQILFLGFQISEQGVQTDPKKIECIVNWPEPTDIKSTRKFLGTTNYYKRFIANYSEIAKPLTTLTSSKVTFGWTPVCQLSFDTLKSCLINAPILGLPRPTGEFILDTDASYYALGGVLSQVQDGREAV